MKVGVIKNIPKPPRREKQRHLPIDSTNHLIRPNTLDITQKHHASQQFKQPIDQIRQLQAGLSDV